MRTPCASALGVQVTVALPSVPISRRTSRTLGVDGTRMPTTSVYALGRRRGPSVRARSQTYAPDGTAGVRAVPGAERRGSLQESNQRERLLSVSTIGQARECILRGEISKF